MKFCDKEEPEILYSDNHLLVLDKPAGWLTQPDDSGKTNLENWAKKSIQKVRKREGNVFLHPIHRLDRPASGIVLFARTSKALSRLNAQMRKKKIARSYLVEVEGVLEKKEGTLKNFLMREQYYSAVVPAERDGAKLAVLHYKVLEEKKSCSTIEVQLETGRYHQIRAQFAYLGHPIIGDEKYGSTLFLKGIHLHHWKMGIFHPISKEEIVFKTNR